MQTYFKKKNILLTIKYFIENNYAIIHYMSFTFIPILPKQLKCYKIPLNLQMLNQYSTPAKMYYFKFYRQELSHFQFNDLILKSY